jgi:4-amino-4-deoxy-L-arabinose transferase-like glycosyltransferase
VKPPAETPLRPHLRLALLATVLALAAILRLWDLQQGATITEYYAAGVRSMMLSAHNFFFNAYDPAGYLSLDKPPVALWLQVLGAELFGYNHFGLTAPQALEGIASCALLYVLVRRRFGDRPALIAAFFLATMPIAIVVDRSNNTDSSLVLALMLAAESLDRAITSGRLSTLLMAAVWVGIGFNAKMMVALGVLPGFLLAYWTGATWPIPRRLRHLTCAALVLAGVSLSWAVAFDLVPPANRPYADSSTNNSMLELIVGHNFVQRFVRDPNTFPQRAQPQPNLRREAQIQAGPLRLLHPALVEQFGWLLPFALAAWWRKRPRAALLLWTGWLIAYAAVFSAAAGIFHPYYLYALTPALAALAAVGLCNLTSSRWALPAALGATLVWQFAAATGVIRQIPISDTINVLLAAAVALTLLALTVAFATARRGIALPAAVASAAILPFAWSLGVLLLPRVTHLAAAAPVPHPDVPTLAWRRPTLDSKLLDYLDAQRGDDHFLLATITTREADPFIIATGAEVMPIGGFNGNDPILSPAAFADAVSHHQVRFVLVRPTRGFARTERRQPVLDWVRSNGTPVDPALWRDAGAEGRAQPVLYDLRPQG